MGGNILSDKAMQDLARMKRLTLGESPAQGPNGRDGHWRPSAWFWGKLTTSLTAGSLESPSTTGVDVWLPDPADTGAYPTFIASPDANLLGLVVVNRTHATGSTGAVVKIEYAFGEWSIKGVDCT